PGLQTSALEIVTDIPNASPRMIALTVDALVAGVSPSPPAIDFGAMPVNTTTFGKSVHLSNCTEATVTISDAYIEGPDASEFAIVATPETLAIPPAGVATYLAVLSTNTGGPTSADLVMEYGDGEVARVARSGEGLDNIFDPGDGDRPKSPYADRGMWLCSAAQPHAWWPFALAFVIVLGRRRRAISR